MINSPTVLAALTPASSSPTVGSWPRLPRRSLKRPRGLWKARRRLDTPPSHSSQHQLLQTTASSSRRGSDTDREEEDEIEASGSGERKERWEAGEDDEEDGHGAGDEDEDELDDMSQASGSSKRQRRDSRSTGSCGSAELLWAAVYVDPTSPSPSWKWSASPHPGADADALDAPGAAAGAGSAATTVPDADADVDARSRPASGRGAGAAVLAINGDAAQAAARGQAALISNMVTTSVAESAPRAKETFEYNDWKEIKETLTRASGLCDRDDPTAAIPLLRAVIHECHRFLVRYPDPALFFSPVVGQRRREGSDSPDSAVMQGEHHPWHEPRWSTRNGSRLSPSLSPSPTPSPSPSPDSDIDWPEHGKNRNHPHHRGESPAALHATLGVALFLFGNIIARDPSLAMGPREPTIPSPYWLAALDVFNAGDNLPCQTSGKDVSSDATSADDWRVAIAWGRTLAALAYEATKQQSTPPSPATARPLTPRAQQPRPRIALPPPARYHPRSPLAAITALRTAGGLAHTRATPPVLLTLAADQFARGIFHMPHPPTPPTPTPTPISTYTHTHMRSDTHVRGAPQRPHVLFTLASEVLAVAERLEDAGPRARWAAWADAVFLQMHMEADVDAWRARLGAARGRCWLVMGSARADEMEDALERGQVGVLASKEAEEARAGLGTAISFFDRAKGSASTESSDKSLVDMQPWLVEALLTLANFTADEDAREALYARAQAEGGDFVARSLGPRLMMRPRTATITMDVRMDES